MKLRTLLSELPKASAQSAALWMAGDAVCQKLEKKSDAGSHAAEGFNFRRTGVNALYGGAFLGPVGHFWYNALDAAVSKALPGGGARMICAKLVADLGLFGPIHLAAFLAWNAAAEATDPRKATGKATTTAVAGAGAGAGAAAVSGGGGGGGGDGGIIWDAMKTSVSRDFVPALVVGGPLTRLWVDGACTRQNCSSVLSHPRSSMTQRTSRSSLNCARGTAAAPALTRWQRHAPHPRLNTGSHAAYKNRGENVVVQYAPQVSPPR